MVIKTNRSELKLTGCVSSLSAEQTLPPPPPPPPPPLSAQTVLPSPGHDHSVLLWEAFTDSSVPDTQTTWLLLLLSSSYDEMYKLMIKLTNRNIYLILKSLTVWSGNNDFDINLYTNKQRQKNKCYGEVHKTLAGAWSGHSPVKKNLVHNI